MAKALQNSLQSDGQSSIPKANTPAYFNSIEKIMDNPQFMNMAESLGSTLMQVHCHRCSYATIYNVFIIVNSQKMHAGFTHG